MDIKQTKLNTRQAGKWVLYRHLANNSPFYIGIGKDPNRPWSKRYRNKHWHNIVNKYGYEVEIIMYDLTEEEAITKEIEFINRFNNKPILSLIINNISSDKFSDDMILLVHGKYVIYSRSEKNNLGKVTMIQII